MRKTCHVNTTVIESGLYLHCVGYVGASPDGVLFCDCCGKSPVEIKCSITEAASNHNHDFEKDFLKRWGEKITLDRNSKYYTQDQVQLYINTVFENISLFSEKFLGPHLIKMSPYPNESEATCISKCGPCLRS